MNTLHRYLPLLWAAFFTVLAGCGELKKDLPAPVSPEAQIHEPAWGDTSAAGFHGHVVKAEGYNTSSCVPCHAQSLNGGTSGVSCYSCHSSFPHVPEWTVGSSPMFHGEYLRTKSWQVGECASCHGSDFSGGTSGTSCYTCHPSFPHVAGWTMDTSVTFHGGYIQVNSWDMRPCRSCHGETYEGGTTGVSCRTCHDQPAGPENCITCHGSANAAPPADLNGNLSTSVRGVGAHQRHLLGGGRYSSLVMTCTSCHTVSGEVYTAGHLDSPLPAEVMLTVPLAIADPTGVPGPPFYDADSIRCGNTFCHGNFSLPRSGSDYAFAYSDSVMVGRNFAARWTGGSAEAACGTCHALPPTGHTPAEISGCSACHSGVMNSSGNIADKSKHINGKINVFGEERPFF